nr:unnamed protein product [Callosobruchus analis]
MKLLVIETWTTDSMYASVNYTTSCTVCHHFFLIWQDRWSHGMEEEREEVVAKFANMGFSNVIGCMDGTDFKIDKSEHDPQSYFNRKKFYSIQVRNQSVLKQSVFDPQFFN